MPTLDTKVDSSSDTAAVIAATDNAAIAARIRAMGAKATRYRVSVLALLSRSQRSMSHSDMEAALAQLAESAMDRVTLYRVLDSLVDKGLALKAVDAHGVYRYSGVEVRLTHVDHMHFHCVDCGGMFCLPDRPPLPPDLPPGFRLHEIEVNIRGACPQCGNAAESTNL